MAFQWTNQLKPYAGLRHALTKEILAEMLGTFILVFMGNAAVAQAVMSGGTRGNFTSINFGYGVAVFLGVLVSGGISGGHINPAVSMSLAVFGKFPWVKVPFYLVAQYTGAFTGSIFLFLIYRNALDAFDPGRTLKSAGIFATYPSTVTNGTTPTEFLSIGNGLGDQIMATFVLLFCVCAITDSHNMGIKKSQIPFAVGLIVFGIGLSLGLNCGYPINPARDLGPRLFTLVAGWGSATFQASTIEGTAWWWVPVVGPHIGGILGVGLYWLLIEVHHEEEKDNENAKFESAKKNGDVEVMTTNSEAELKYVKVLEDRVVAPKSLNELRLPRRIEQMKDPVDH